MYTNSMIERENDFRKKLVKCTNVNEDVMSIYYGITTNKCKPILMESMSINRLLTKHGDNGYVIISANRNENTDEENIQKTNELKYQITLSGRSYLPVYGGYRNEKTGEEAQYEPSFVVFNYNTDGDKMSIKELVNMAKQWCAEYQQDCAYVKLPGKDLVYMNAAGKIVNKRESGKVAINDPNKEYFTSLTDEHPQDGEMPKRRFSSDIEFPDDKKGEVAPDRDIENFENINEWYCNPIPCTLNEMRRRMAMHEVMIYV